MEIDLEMVRAVYCDLLDGRMSREAADRWAFTVQQHSDAGTLTFSPPTEEQRIWDAVMFLYGIDLMSSPSEYLHTDDDVRAAMESKLGVS